MLTYERLREVLDYNQDTGVFTWKKCGDRRIPHGKIAGTNSHGYITIQIDKKFYKAHRLAWFFVHGYLPEHNIDHINRVRDANWIENLREVSQSCNMRNCEIFSTNNSSVKGVAYHKKRKKWRAYVTVNKKHKYIGRYDDFDEAVCARLAAEQCLNWEGCDSDSPAYRYVQNMLWGVLRQIKPSRPFC